VDVVRAAVAATIVLAAGCAEPIGPADIVIANPQEFVSTARQLLEEARKDPSKPTEMEDDRLPPTLRIKSFDRARWPIAAHRHARLHGDHLDLVLVRHPDGEAGARVWAATHRVHQDAPTQHRDIYFYVYSKEDPESPANIW
jgi:hypothetical protein